MSELDFELIDESADQDDSIIETNEEDASTSAKAKNEDEDKNTTSTKSKKSNWKKMQKASKAKDKRIADLEAKLAKQDSQSDKEEFEFEDEDGFDKTEFRFFIIENPEAKDYKDELMSTLEKYPSMSFNDALTLVKAKTPKESTSSNDFSSKWSNIKVRKRLADLTEEEALKLPNGKYLEYQRLKGKIRR